MPIPMMGAVAATVLGARPYSIHGDNYIEAAVRLDGEEAPIAVRIPSHVMKDLPQAGERIELSFLMGQVTGARRL